MKRLMGERRSLMVLEGGEGGEERGRGEEAK